MRRQTTVRLADFTPKPKPLETGFTHFFSLFAHPSYLKQIYHHAFTPLPKPSIPPTSGDAHISKIDSYKEGEV